MRGHTPLRAADHADTRLSEPRHTPPVLCSGLHFWSSPLSRSTRFGLVQATALNMINMIGIGPFITIPLLMTALGGPQAMLGWIVALVIVICDGMVWSELGAAMPGSGGSFGYLREAFGRETFGRLMAFLFVWQFILSGPLEIASGYIGFSQYLGYIWQGLSARALFLVAAAVGVLNVVLLYRRITSIATITVSLWVGTLVDDAGGHRDRRAALRSRTSRSTFRPARSTSRWDSSSASAPRRASASTTISATTTSATSATRSRIRAA